MALNTLKSNYWTPLHFKGLKNDQKSLTCTAVVMYLYHQLAAGE